MMNKKLIIAISIVLLTVVLGMGIYHSDAAKSSPELTYEDISEIVEAQYPGTITEIEQDRKHGKAVYEVEIKDGEKHYELNLDANTGEILELEEKRVKQDIKLTNEQENKIDTNNTEEQEVNDSTLIMDMEEAIAIALQEFQGTVTEAELDKENGRYIYEIEIKSNGVEAEVEIDAQTGEILVVEIDD